MMSFEIFEIESERWQMFNLFLDLPDLHSVKAYLKTS